MMEVYLDEVPKDDFEEYFRFVENIAAGAFGKVIRAIDLKTNEEVAVKVIDKELHSKRLNMIKQEITILQQLKHKNIVKFLNFRDANTKLYIVMSLLSGGTIKNLVEKRKLMNKPLTEEECSVIIKHLLEAVKYLHEREIVHRDIKPDNVMFEKPEDFTSLKLIDFGLSAQHFDNIFLYDLCGTLIYMAPEQLEKRAYSKPIDMWSCGMIMFILLNNGRHPFYTKGMTTKNFVAKLKNFSLDETIKESRKNKTGGPGVNSGGGSEKNSKIFPDKKESFTGGSSQNAQSGTTQNYDATPSAASLMPEIKMSRMARSLLNKLLEINPSRRYTVDKALNHPWITRDRYQDIPETYFEAWRLSSIKRKFKQAFGVTLFLINYNQLKSNAKSTQKKSRPPSNKINLMQYALLVNKISKEQNEKFNVMRDKYFDPFFSSGEKPETIDKKEKMDRSTTEQGLFMNSNLLGTKFIKKKPIKLDTNSASALTNSPIHKNKTSSRVLHEMGSPSSPIKKRLKMVPSSVSNTSSRNNIFSGNGQNPNQSYMNNNVITNSNTNNTTNTGGMNYPSSYYSGNSSNLPSPTHSDSLKYRKEKFSGDKHHYKKSESHTTGISQQNSNNYNNLASLDYSNIIEHNELSSDKLRESLEDEIKDTVNLTSERKNLPFYDPRIKKGEGKDSSQEINIYNGPPNANQQYFKKSMKIVKKEDEFKLNLKSLDTDSADIDENYNPVVDRYGYSSYSKIKKNKINSMSFNKLKFSELNLNTDVSKNERNERNDRYHYLNTNNVMQGFSTPCNKNIVIKKSYIINSKLEKNPDEEKYRMPINITKNLIDKIVVGKLHAINTNALNNLCYPNQNKKLGTPLNNKRSYQLSQVQTVSQVQNTYSDKTCSPKEVNHPKTRKVSFNNIEVNMASDVVLPPIQTLGNKNKTSKNLSKLNPSINNKPYYVFK